MPRFRYEAVDSSGVPIHGTTDVESESALIKHLSVRGLELVSSSELSLESLVGAHAKLLPRLQQLRIGEQLREALLTGLPAHEALKAIAAEPISHPMLGVAPWLQAMSVLVFLALTGVWAAFGYFGGIIPASGLLTFVVVPLVWMGLIWIYRIKPKHLLHKLAGELESGSHISASLRTAMPREIQFVMKSQTDDATKARVAGDLVPALLGSNLRSQQFVMTLVGPLVLFAVVLFGIHSTLLFIIPKFKQIFEDFGTDLPVMTEMVVAMSDLAASLGTAGWLIVALCLAAGLIALVLGLSSGWGAELLESVPLFGVAFRWAMQAKVARVLAAMIRNNCAYPEAIRTATAGSGFQSVCRHGDLLAKELETQSGQALPSRQLSGLPISMLFSTENAANHDEHRAALADTFQNLSEMLDSATVGQGRLLAVILQFLTILFTAVIIAFGVLAMFLPLIKLLNALS